MLPLKVKASLTRMSRVKDGSVNISFRTMEEISADDFSLMDRYWNSDGWLVYKKNEIDIDDIPTDIATGEGKTPSQRLRGVIYAKYAHDGRTDDFQTYYNKVIEGFIQAVKDKM